MDLRLRSESKREAEDHGREKRNKEEEGVSDGDRGFAPK